MFSRVDVSVCTTQALWDERGDGRLLPHSEKTPIDNFGEHEKAFNYMKPAKLASHRLNRDHSHFILVDDGSVGNLGTETCTRSAFENVLHLGHHESNERVRESLVRQKLGWQRTKLDHELKRSNGNSKDNTTTAITICVQGGAQTVRKVVESVRGGTPVLLIKGSGMTSDLLADAVEVAARIRVRQGLDDDAFARTSSASSTASKSSAASFASMMSAQSAGTDISLQAMERNKLMQRLLTNDPDDDWLQADVQKAYNVTYNQDFGKIVEQVIEISQCGLCEVFDIHKSQEEEEYIDLSGAMLLCAIKKEIANGKQWHECLPLVVQWNHEHILKQLLGRLHMNAGPVKNAFERSFHDAFLDNKVSGVVSCVAALNVLCLGALNALVETLEHLLSLFQMRLSHLLKHLNICFLQHVLYSCLERLVCCGRVRLVCCCLAGCPKPCRMPESGIWVRPNAGHGVMYQKSPNHFSPTPLSCRLGPTCGRRAPKGEFATWRVW